jgi:hypothetical protein
LALRRGSLPRERPSLRTSAENRPRTNPVFTRIVLPVPRFYATSGMLWNVLASTLGNTRE